MQRIAILLLALTLTGCGIQSSGGRHLDPDEEFAKLDSPDVTGVEESLLQSAKSAEEKHNYERAASFYKQLADQYADNYFYAYKLAESVRKAGDAEVAKPAYEKLLEQEPDNLDVREGYGLCLMATGEFVEAGRELAKVLERDPERWRTLNALGILFTTKNMVDEAIAYFDEALLQNPNNAAVMNNKGLAQAIDRRYRDAVNTLDNARRRAASDTRRKKQISLNLALVLGVSGNLQQAEKVASEHLDGPALTNNLGLYAHLSKNDELAKSYLNMALSHSPVFYERAWENLDIITQQSENDKTGERTKQKSYKIR